MPPGCVPWSTVVSLNMRALHQEAAEPYGVFSDQVTICSLSQQRCSMALLKHITNTMYIYTLATNRCSCGFGTQSISVLVAKLGAIP